MRDDETPLTNAALKATQGLFRAASECNGFTEHARRMERDRARAVELLRWIDEIAMKNYEQDQKLRANGARTLLRISEKARAFLRSLEEAK